MKLYHGSNMAFEEIDLLLCRPNKDFGRGFYLTPERKDAENMARRTARRYGGLPCVLTFDLRDSDLVDVPVRRFVHPDESWAMFVMANRRPERPASDHNRDNRYGLVVGPIANDDLALLFRQFELGLVTSDMLVREMQFKRLAVQYSFHTAQAIAALEFVEATNVH